MIKKILLLFSCAIAAQIALHSFEVETNLAQLSTMLTELAALVPPTPKTTTKEITLTVPAVEPKKNETSQPHTQPKITSLAASEISKTPQTQEEDIAHLLRGGQLRITVKSARENQELGTITLTTEDLPEVAEFYPDTIVQFDKKLPSLPHIEITVNFGLRDNRRHYLIKAGGPVKDAYASALALATYVNQKVLKEESKMALSNTIAELEQRVEEFKDLEKDEDFDDIPEGLLPIYDALLQKIKQHIINKKLLQTTGLSKKWKETYETAIELIQDINDIDTNEKRNEKWAHIFAKLEKSIKSKGKDYSIKPIKQIGLLAVDLSDIPQALHSVITAMQNNPNFDIIITLPASNKEVISAYVNNLYKTFDGSNRARYHERLIAPS